MPKKANITISHKGKASDTDINNGSFKVNLGQEGQLNWLSEKTSFGSGDQTDLPRLIQEHDELQGKGEHAIVGFDVKHRGKAKSLVGKLDKPLKISDDGDLILRGKILKDLESSNKLDIVDIAGEERAKSHNRHNSNDFSSGARIVGTKLTTFTVKELSKVYDSNSIPTSHQISFTEPSSRVALVDLNSKQLDSSNRFTASDSFTITKDIPIGSSTLTATTTFTPTLTGNVNTPPFLEGADLKDYNLEITTDLKWDASITLQLGSDDGTIPIPAQKIPGPLDIKKLLGSVSSGIDFQNSTINLPGLSNTFKIGASQNSAKSTITITLDGGIENKSSHDPVIGTLPNIDLLTGVGISIDSTSFIDITVGLQIPDSLNFLHLDSPNFKASLSVPMKFDFDAGSSQNLDVTASGTLDATIDLSLFNWINKTLYSGELFSWDSGNLF